MFSGYPLRAEDNLIDEQTSDLPPDDDGRPVITASLPSRLRRRLTSLYTARLNSYLVGMEQQRCQGGTLVACPRHNAQSNLVTEALVTDPTVPQSGIDDIRKLNFSHIWVYLPATGLCTAVTLGRIPGEAAARKAAR